MSGFHHDLDHFEGLFFGVIVTIGDVRALRLRSNHSAISVEDSISLGVNFLMNSSKRGHGVNVNWGELFAVGGFGGLILIWITVWSEPEEGRLLTHE